MLLKYKRNIRIEDTEVIAFGIHEQLKESNQVGVEPPPPEPEIQFVLRSGVAIYWNFDSVEERDAVMEKIDLLTSDNDEIVDLED